MFNVEDDSGTRARPETQCSTVVRLLNATPAEQTRNNKNSFNEKFHKLTN